MRWRAIGERLVRPGRVRTTALVVVSLGLCMEVGLHHRELRGFCYDCGTERHLVETRLFSWEGPRAPFRANFESVEPSRTYGELFGPGHEHRWGWYAGGNLREWFFTGPTQCGTAPPGEVLSRHEEDAAFREKARHWIASARMSREDFVTLLGVSGRRQSPEREAQVREVANRNSAFLAQSGPWRYGALPYAFDRYLK